MQKLNIILLFITIKVMGEKKIELKTKRSSGTECLQNKDIPTLKLTLAAVMRKVRVLRKIKLKRLSGGEKRQNKEMLLLNLILAFIMKMDGV